MHPGQLTVDASTVRGLVDEQFPAWRDLPVRAVPQHGTVNALFRLGERLVARLPLVPADVASTRAVLRAEAAAARELAGRTRFSTPHPVALGEPGAGYPMPWSVQTWVPGTPATPDAPGHSEAFAQDLAAFITDLRAIDTGGRAFSGGGRGGRLFDHDEWMATCFARSAGLVDVDPLRRLWAAVRQLPPTPGGDLMTHGDLIPGNVLVAGGRLVGVIDVGGSGPADPALDLVAGWHLLAADPRRAFRRDLRVDDLQWARGAAWALEQAMGAVWYYAVSNPTMSRMGRRTLQRIVEDPPRIPACAAPG
jgi:aminoglycoside phosphotransferase (APT) family kinase protein